ncbi:XrtB/PEP-CTERM-associated polysaccharide biosynthesis outer membrane protein EpsL [Methylotenera sp.]|jgi:exopolysaccharide biosynthesis operon protein EpsL|uniref:XrtB/PEP-CTERM-associated polysaccharide biosynthesis outer membrane protein EpsL n=3 Tax=Methylotenera sp. TaxID=2051956 RepID=UPI00271FF39B|nr:putative exosortase B-associated extracellular polysaccharide biosynthesis transporter EpsL [Methylotenera sp.]
MHNSLNKFKIIDFSKPSWMKVFMLLSLCLPTFLIFPMAHADENDPINFIAGISRVHDNNLFRESTMERSDNITTAYAGVRLDKQYSMQRFKADFTLTAYRYQKYDVLDFDAKDYKGAWLWKLTPYLSGTLSADRKQQLTTFEDYRNLSVVTLQNVRVSENQHFEADFSPHGIWHLLGGATRSTQSNSKTFQAEDSFTMNALDAGVKYDFRSGSSITLMGHERRGNYEDRTINTATLFDTKFDESEAEAKLSWLISGKSQVNARAAYVTRNHDNFSQRDYSGVVGRVDYRWMPAGKLSITASASSDLSSFQTDYSSYTRNNTLSISPVYALSDKISMRATASASERTFLGEVGISINNGRVDTSKSISLGVDWTPLRSVTIGANLARSSRSSNLAGFDFTDTTAGLNANLFF